MGAGRLPRTAMGPGPNQRGLSRQWVMAAAAASINRLGADYIDILYLHKEDLEFESVELATRSYK